MNFWEINANCSTTFWNANETYEENRALIDCVENHVFKWIPYLFLWAFMPMEVYFLRTSKSRDIPLNVWVLTKLIFIIFLTLTSLKDLTYEWKKNVDDNIDVVKFCSFVLFFLLTWGNIKRGIRSSGILFLFSFFSVICSLPKVYRIVVTNELFDGVDNAFWYALNFISTFFILLFNCFCDPEPLYSLCATDKKSCPANNASFVSNLFLSWYSQYIWENNKNSFTENLWNLDYEETTEFTMKKLEKHLNKFYSKLREKSSDSSQNERLLSDPLDEFNLKPRVSIVQLFLETYGWEYLWTLIYGSVSVIFILSYPILFGYLITCIRKAKPFWIMNIFTLGFFINCTLNSLIRKKATLNMSKIHIRIRAVLTSIIYKKIMRVSGRAKSKYSSGELLTLIISDVVVIIQGLIILQQFFSTPIYLLLSFYYIWNMFGFGSLISFVVMILLLPINNYLTKGIQKLSNVEDQNKYKRGKFIHDLMMGIKVLKMYAWESSFQNKASSLRQEEFSVLKENLIRNALLLFMYNCIPFMLSFVSFTVYMSFTEEVIDYEKAFVTIMFFNIFKRPLKFVSSNIKKIIKTQLSMKRIDTFLSLPEIDENVVTHDPLDEALIIEGGIFSWSSPDGPPVLIDLNIKIPKGSLVTVVGAVGAGKSSLISAFLGELYKISGYINVNGKIAYMSQQPWILNTTFKENIILGRQVDEDIYEKVLDLCALRKDIESLPAGDLSEIGEKGINLSGGQKQRISLARIICCDADIYFFDDCLSAVDFQTAKHIFEGVLGPNGLLKGKTRVFVTHNISFFQQSDVIVYLQNGFIAEHGTFEELLNRTSYFSDFLMNFTDGSESLQKTDDLVPVPIRKLSKHIEEDSNESWSLGKTTTSFDGDAKLIQKERVELGTVKKRVYLYIISIIGYSSLLSFFLWNILTQVLTVMNRIWLAIWSSVNIERQGKNYQLPFLSIYAGLGLSETITSLISTLIFLTAILRTSNVMYNELIRSILKWPLWILDTTPIGRIINRVMIDSYELDDIGKRLVILLELGNKFFIIALLICYVSPICVWIFVLTCAIVYILKNWHHSMALQMKRIASNNISVLTSFITETVNGKGNIEFGISIFSATYFYKGLDSIRGNGYDKKFISMSNEKIDFYSSNIFPSYINESWFTIRIDLLNGAIVSLLIFFITLQRDTMDIGTICFVMSFAVQWTNEFVFLLYNIGELEKFLVTIERLKEFIDFPKEKNNPTIHAEELLDWPKDGTIEFKNYHLKYHEKSDLVLHGLSFKINGGEKIGIVGRTGAGKSSLIIGILRLVEPQDGTIFIDHKDITQIDLQVLRSRLTVIPQDPVLFVGTLRFNLDPEKKHGDDSLWNALEKAHLKKFVRQLSAGLDFFIEEGGINMSCGQRQLICLARALLRKTKILLLDEATASVDLETDELIQNTIRNEFKECTVLTIAHRLNTVQDYERILVLDSGNVVEFDTPSNLIYSKNSVFYDIMRESGLIPK